MTAADQLASLREALRDLHTADAEDCVRYKVRVYQQWGRDSLVASAWPLPHGVVLAGLLAMERELAALAEVAV